MVYERETRRRMGHSGRYCFFAQHFDFSGQSMGSVGHPLHGPGNGTNGHPGNGSGGSGKGTDQRNRLTERQKAMVAEHWPMVAATMRWAARRGWPVDDQTESDIARALVMSALRYDPAMGSCFKTHAFRWLRGALLRSVKKTRQCQGHGPPSDQTPAPEPIEAENENADRAALVWATAIAELTPANQPIARLIVRGWGWKRIRREFDLTEHDARETTRRIKRWLYRMVQMLPLSETPTLFDL